MREIKKKAFFAQPGIVPLLAALATPIPAQTVPTPLDEVGITELFVEIVQSWGQKPTSLIASRFVPEVQLIDPHRRRLRGVEQIRGAYTELLRRGLLQGSQLTVDLEEFHSKDSQTVTVEGAWGVSWPHAGGRIPEVGGRFSVDVVGVDSPWRFRAVRLLPGKRR